MTKRIKLFAIMFSIILVVALVGSIGATAAIWTEGAGGGGQDTRGTSVAIDEWNAWAKYFSYEIVGDGVYVANFNTGLGFNSTTLVIPRSVAVDTSKYNITGITGSAFANSALKEMIEEIRIPASVKVIGASAFSGFVNLKRVIFESGSTCEVKEFAFSATPKLTEISDAGSTITYNSLAFFESGYTRG